MPNVLVVGPSIDAPDYQAFAADARQHPDDYTVFSTGNGSDPHLAADEFQENTGLKFRHIPYKGGAQGMVDMLRGRVDLSFRSDEHTSELQSLMRISYAVFCLKNKLHATVLDLMPRLV